MKLDWEHGLVRFGIVAAGGWAVVVGWQDYDALVPADQIVKCLDLPSKPLGDVFKPSQFNPFSHSKEDCLSSVEAFRWAALLRLIGGVLLILAVAFGARWVLRGFQNKPAR